MEQFTKHNRLPETFELRTLTPAVVTHRESLRVFVDAFIDCMTLFIYKNDSFCSYRSQMGYAEFLFFRLNVPLNPCEPTSSRHQFDDPSGRFVWTVTHPHQ